MRPHRILITAAIVAFIATGIAQIPGLGLAADAPAGNVSVPGAALNSLIGEQEGHFNQAIDLYVKGDFHGAASEIRSGAALLRMEAGRASGEDAAKLQTAASDLDTLAANIVSGNVGSRRDLELAFGNADLALAAHYHALAGQALAAKDHAAAGRWLKAANDSLDDATSWTGERPPATQAEAQDQMHALQAKIRTGAAWSEEEAKKGMNYLGTRIQYLGQQMQNVGGAKSASK
jgi:hypothetical protein